MSASAGCEVAVLQHRLLQYRVPFFERLRTACADQGLRLRLVHGQASPREVGRNDTATLPWADVVRNRYCRVGSRDLLWQPFPVDLHRAGLVVLMQENRILSNYRWLLGDHHGGSSPRVAYWGHGRNFQSTAPRGWRERWKAALRNRVDWWFAYTEASREAVAAGGFPDERITVLDNAIDNDGFAADLAAVTPLQADALRARIDGSHGPVALYCGSLYPDKRIDLLVEAGDLLVRDWPGFRLVVVGDGPSRGELELAAATRPWLHSVGAQRGRDKAGWFRIADCCLSPGAVGLHVLDAFCAGLPLLTTDSAPHGPEVAYLDPGRNAFVVEARAHALARACRELFGDPGLSARVRAAATADSHRYTLDNMVQRFMSGISGCLAAPPIK